MSTIYLPDTNAFSRAARKQDKALQARFEAEAEKIQLSAVVWFELTYGVEKSPHLPQITARLDRLREAFPQVLAFAEDAAWHAARVRVALDTARPNAKPIGPFDTLLAGQALSLGAVFVTHNTAEFSRVPGLRIEDWQTA
jgi:tRNA(fMet)-specific endonuclease VapC